MKITALAVAAAVVAVASVSAAAEQPTLRGLAEPPNVVAPEAAKGASTPDGAPKEAKAGDKKEFWGGGMWGPGWGGYGGWGGGWGGGCGGGWGGGWGGGCGGWGGWGW
ncbi:hypothetical protein BBJ28_00025730 [Nothophytophthora sp. Chile5]|nr:hypothetical protein BBJ28_00025730 [Nothophytophthora sp. Chile5]